MKCPLEMHQHTDHSPRFPVSRLLSTCSLSGKFFKFRCDDLLKDLKGSCCNWYPSSVKNDCISAGVSSCAHAVKNHCIAGASELFGPVPMIAAIELHQLVSYHMDLFVAVFVFNIEFLAAATSQVKQSGGEKSRPVCTKPN